MYMNPSIGIVIGDAFWNAKAIGNSKQTKSKAVRSIATSTICAKCIHFYLDIKAKNEYFFFKFSFDHRIMRLPVAIFMLLINIHQRNYISLMIGVVIQTIANTVLRPVLDNQEFLIKNYKTFTFLFSITYLCSLICYILLTTLDAYNIIN